MNKITKIILFLIIWSFPITACIQDIHDETPTEDIRSENELITETDITEPTSTIAPEFT